MRCGMIAMVGLGMTTACTGELGVDTGDSDPEVGTAPSSTIAADALRDATDGLWYTSETDDYATVFVIADAGDPMPTLDTAAASLTSAWPADAAEPGIDGRVLVEVDLARFFDRLTVEQEWWEPSQQADAIGWRAARAVFEDELQGSTVFRFGERSQGDDVDGAVEVFVVGAAEDGALVGFNVLSVET